jgi:hypothetical protein
MITDIIHGACQPCVITEKRKWMCNVLIGTRRQVTHALPFLKLPVQLVYIIMCRYKTPTGHFLNDCLVQKGAFCDNIFQGVNVRHNYFTADVKEVIFYLSFGFPLVTICIIYIYRQ